MTIFLQNSENPEFRDFLNICENQKHVKQREEPPVFHHVGVYAYKTKTLLSYNSWGESNLELLEGLEQIRFLENTCSIKCVPVDSKGRKFWELNNPEDVQRIENVINENLYEKRKEK